MADENFESRRGSVIRQSVESADVSKSNELKQQEGAGSM